MDDQCQEQCVKDIGDKRQRILDAAFIIFSRKGYNRTTIDEIIALADTAKGTVYNYFGNKEMLFYSLITERTHSFEAALGEVLVSDQPIEDKIKSAIRLFLKFFSANSDLWRALIHELRGFEMGCAAISKHTRQQYQKILHGVSDALEKMIADGISQGVLKEYDASKVGFALWGLIMALVYNDMVGDDVNAIADTITAIFLHGMAKGNSTSC